MKDCHCGGRDGCGCCAGFEPLTPLATANRPGLDTLVYRVGTHATFLETMMAGLSSHRLEDSRRPLQRFTTRATDDPALAVLDAWATVADVLTFYQERIANEGYLATATERRSILELARLVGYRLRPGVAASVFLAFTLDDGFDVEIPAGTGARSLPGPEELPQVFETDEALDARSAWNAISPRLTIPSFLPPSGSANPRGFYLTGTATALKANDAVLFVCGSAEPVPQIVRAVETDAEADHTLITYASYGAISSSATPLRAKSPGISVRVEEIELPPPPPLARLGLAVRALERPPSLQPPSRFQLARPLEQTYNAASDLGPRVLTRFVPRLQQTLYTAYANVPVAADPDMSEPCQVEALRVKAAPFGHSALKELIFEDNVLDDQREWDLAELPATLDVDVSSGFDESIVDAFLQTFTLVDDFPRLDFVIEVADEVGSEVFTSLALSELEPLIAGGLVYEKSRSIRGVTATVRAEYAQQQDAAFILVAVGVRFESGPQNREVRIRATRSDEVTILLVQASGVEEEILVFPGDHKSFDAEAPDGRMAVVLDQDVSRLQIKRHDPHFATSESVHLLSLDATYDEIVPGSYVLVDRADREPITARVVSLRTISRVDYGLSAKVTQLRLDHAWLEPEDALLTVVRNTTVYAQSERLELAEEPLEESVHGSEIELDGLYEGLEAGRWLVVRGERADVLGPGGEVIPGIEASELVMLAGVEHDVRKMRGQDGQGEIELPGDTLHTRLILARPLEFEYQRSTVKINANVARATHGETQEQTLGHGDASQAFQRFTLGKSPLTYVAAPTPKGVESTLEVRVEDVRWHEHDTLLELAAEGRGYVTRTDDEGNTSVLFGDGRRGARLPTGNDNVTAVYRDGIGKGGNVEAEQISNLATRPLGVKGVINPERASGGADPESRDQARDNVPLAVLALDRLVSVQDYADFTRTFAGIGKAAATSLSDGRRQVIHLTIAGAEDAPIDVGSDLYRNLLLALARFGDPSVVLQVAPREAVFVFLSARVALLEDYLWDKVEPQVRAALLKALGFDRRKLGQDVLLSEVVSLIQQVEGVAHVDVDLLDGVTETEALDPETLAQKLEDLAVSGTASTSTSTAEVCRGTAQPRQRLHVELARIDATAEDAAMRVRPAQMAYLNPDLPDTLILEEVTP